MKEKMYETDTLLHCFCCVLIVKQIYLGLVHTGPKSQVTSSQSTQSEPLRAWKLGLGTQGLKFQVPSTTWMPTWLYFFGGEA